MTSSIKEPSFPDPLLKSKFPYSIEKLDPKAKKNIFIGRKESITLCEFNEHKNLAISAIAIGIILLVGSIVSLSLGALALSSVFNYAGLTCIIGGSIYLVKQLLLNPKYKIEHQREKMRFLPLERILEEKGLDYIEGFDLLKNVIKDKSLDSQKIYTYLRQLNRNYQNLKLLKVYYQAIVQEKYAKQLDSLNKWQDNQIRKILNLKDTEIFNEKVVAKNPKQFNSIKKVEEIVDRKLLLLKTWEIKYNLKIDEEFRNAVNLLEGTYQQEILGN